ncbi:hypothetical protein EV356DRAFT_218224 [Viridothelium virens]|uniref:Uncharacterized protein n=1 Tax=Viridothelium virens TaxID=1048519 RepID=A0A6A6H5C8_VIRVR|nr:hypothetical protein EV356DRAFT_218224 [Viridothelium virens]
MICASHSFQHPSCTRLRRYHHQPKYLFGLPVCNFRPYSTRQSARPNHKPRCQPFLYRASSDILSLGLSGLVRWNGAFLSSIPAQRRSSARNLPSAPAALQTSTHLLQTPLVTYRSHLGRDIYRVCCQALFRTQINKYSQGPTVDCCSGVPVRHRRLYHSNSVHLPSLTREWHLHPSETP